MKTFDCTQKGNVWARLRAGMPTASEFDELVTAKGKVKEGLGPKSFLARKVAEYWWGGPLPTLGGSWQQEQGNILEDEAVPWYEERFDEDIQRIGFCTTDDEKAGCSPDVLLGDDCGIEIKCPEMHTHVKYLLDGGLPDEYALQVQGSMYVTGRPMWKFMSYRRKLPILIIAIERDEKMQAALREALEQFHANFLDAVKTMELRNNGPVKRPFNQAWFPLAARFEWLQKGERILAGSPEPIENSDIIP